MSGTGIEPMSPAWKANMLTTTPTARFGCWNCLFESLKGIVEVGIVDVL